MELSADFYNGLLVGAATATIATTFMALKIITAEIRQSRKTLAVAERMLDRVREELDLRDYLTNLADQKREEAPE